MQEIKLYGSEVSKKEEWKKIQLRYYSLNIKSLKLEQYQLIGFSFFTQIKNILISYLAAKETINSNISLGMLLSIS
ncbi:peptidase domain-containing ABC transporter, partial [Escherichia coli]